jgi:HlyD family secretion protein
MSDLRIQAKLLVCLILIAVLLAGCSQIGSAPPTPEINWEDEVAQAAVVSATGKVLPLEWASLSFAMAGLVREVVVTEGQTVAQGAVLARLDAPEMEAAVLQARAGLLASQQELARMGEGPRPEVVARAEAAVATAEEAAQAAHAQAAVAQANVALAEAAHQVALAAQRQVEAGPTADDLELARQQVEQAKALRYAAQAQRDVIGGNKGKPGFQASAYEAAEGQAMAADNSVTMAESSARILAGGARPADRAAARAQAEQARVAVQVAEEQLAAAQQAAAVSDHQVEQARAELALARLGATESELAIGRARVEQARAALAAAEAALSKATLVAPLAGTVAAIDLRPGEWAMPGVPVISLGDVAALRVETTDLDEIDVARVRVGAPVRILFDALPDVTLEGTVESIALKAGAGSGGTTYRVIISLNERHPALRWGMTAFVDIQAEE